jgi:hypothetical protein
MRSAIALSELAQEVLLVEEHTVPLVGLHLVEKLQRMKE